MRLVEEEWYGNATLVEITEINRVVIGDIIRDSELSVML